MIATQFSIFQLCFKGSALTIDCPDIFWPGSDKMLADQTPFDSCLQQEERLFTGENGTIITQCCAGSGIAGWGDKPKSPGLRLCSGLPP